MEDVDILFGHLVHFTAILVYCVAIWKVPYGYLVYFSSFGMLRPEKSGNPEP
jgi:hypothetical protein